MEYHRTFLSLNVCRTIYNEDERYQNVPSGPPNRQKKIDSDPAFKNHVHSCPRYPQRAPGPPMDRQYDAFLARDIGVFEPIVIIPKRGQQFNSVATSWERTNSELCAGNGFSPVVNSFMEVTAHCGNVPAESLIHPKGIYYTDISDYIANGVDLYLIAQVFDAATGQFVKGSVNSYPEGWEPFWSQDTYPKPTISMPGYGGGIDVMVMPNGKVVSVKGRLFSRNNGQAIPTWSPLDFWTPGTRFAAGAIRAITNRVGALAKAGFRFLAAPTKELAALTVARLGAGDTLTGMAVTARGAIRMETVGRRAVFAVDDMQTLKAAVATSKAEPGLYDVVIHGNNKSFYIEESGVWKKVSVQDVADMIRPHLEAGDEIRLLACEAGRQGGPAQELANRLQRKVWAADESVFPRQGKAIKFDADGNAIDFDKAKSFVPKNGGTFNAFRPVPHRGGAAVAGGGKVTGNEVRGEIGRAK
jgi:hypothetical protein